VSCCERICVGRRKINLRTVFAGQNVGIKEVSDKVWLVSFMQYELGFFDHETGRVFARRSSFLKVRARADEEGPAGGLLG
jgi:putative transposase